MPVTTWTWDPMDRQMRSMAGPVSNEAVHTEYSAALDPVREVLTNSYYGQYWETVSTWTTNHQPLTVASGFNAPAGDATTFEWDTTNGLLLATVDALGRRSETTWSNTLPVAVRLSGVTLASMAYSTNGLLTSVTNANGHVTRFEYNALGLVTNVIPAAGPASGVGRTALGFVNRVIEPGPSGTRVTGMEV